MAMICMPDHVAASSAGDYYVNNFCCSKMNLGVVKCITHVET